MARIQGVDIPDDKRGEIALTYVYGIGRTTARNILEKSKVDTSKKVAEWTDAEATAIRNVISSEIKVEGALRSDVQMSIKRLMDIGCYRGIRHRKGLPVRGQRTKNMGHGPENKDHRTQHIDGWPGPFPLLVLSCPVLSCPSVDIRLGLLVCAAKS